MKKHVFSFVTVLFLSISFANAQSNDIAGIEKTVNMYFDGWMHGDTTKLGKAMHSTCKLKNIKEGEVVVFERTKYLSLFQPHPKTEGSTGRIISIDITGPIASAKCELEIPNRLFTDYFNMMRVNDEWVIVDKISTNVAKE